MTRKLIAVVVVVAALGLTACERESLDEVRKNAEFTKVCRDGGGKTDYDGFGNLRCNFWGGK